MSEKFKIIFKILSLYLITSILFLGYFFVNDYDMKKNALITNEVKNLKEIKMGIYMKATMEGIEAISSFMSEKGVKACIISQNQDIIYKNTDCELNLADNSFVLDGKVGIFETLQNMENDGFSELSKANIFLVGKSIQNELNSLKFTSLIKFTLSILAIMLIAFYLAKLSIKPLYEKIAVLNRFIKDSTHEINTPLSIIMMSIETMIKSDLGSKNLKRINNIELAAKTLSKIYEDLVYLSFDRRSNFQKINFKDLVNERLGYFTPFFIKRELKVEANLDEVSINADLYEITRMLDNLLSNAVKYSNLGGLIEINLLQGKFEITNNGESIPKALKDKIFERYTRFNKDQGGFGIGLSLVKKVCENSGILVSCNSEENAKTTFILKWD
nr:HAMP domain-containing histidine kinase [Campylobacter sp.]